MMRPQLCVLCAEGASHIQHWFAECDCAAAGIGFDHSTHCSLYEVELKTTMELRQSSGD